MEQLAPGNRVWISTFHSLGAQPILRNTPIASSFDRNFTIYDMADRDKVVKDALEAAGFDKANSRPKVSAAPSARPRTS